MKANPTKNFVAARWILTVGVTLLLGVIALTTLADRKADHAKQTKPSSSASSSESSRSSQTGPSVVGADTPPWLVGAQDKRALPEGVVPVSEINPPPPDPNEPPPPTPVEPPNPATHRP